MKKIIHFESIDSTNTYLKKMYEHYQDFQIVSTNHQTAGRGRLGNLWFDNHSSALFSILIKRFNDPLFCTKIPLIASISAHKVLSNMIKNLTIKWPNDLMVNEKKLGGILTESIIVDGKILAIVVGFGINLGVIDSIKSNDYQITSVWEEIKIQVSIESMMNEIRDVFLYDLTHFQISIDEYLSYYKKYSSILGKRITFVYDGISYEGICKDITKDGNIRVKTPHQDMCLSSGEINLIRT